MADTKMLMLSLIIIQCDMGQRKIKKKLRKIKKTQHKIDQKKKNSLTFIFDIIDICKYRIKYFLHINGKYVSL